jgi:hypothetical protein
MAHESLVAAPPASFTVETTHVQAPDLARLSPTRMADPSPEQVQAADGIFAERHEASVIAGLAGLWTSALLLHDLAVEHFDVKDEEEDLEGQEPPAE